MTMNYQQLSFLLVTLMVVCVTESQGRCDSNLCAPVVSKCLLTDACECNIKTNMVDLTPENFNCSCCKRCATCLGDKLLDCCGCVNLCSTKIDKSMTLTSSIEILSDPMTALFTVLTEEEDLPLMRWTTYKYPVHQDLFVYQPTEPNSPTFNVAVDGQSSSNKKHHTKKFLPSIDRNCTVAFMSDCMPLVQCKSSCKSMGAGKFRWFHERGCCQCISSECFDYGKNKAMCSRCTEQGTDKPKTSVKADTSKSSKKKEGKTNTKSSAKKTTKKT